MPYCNVYLSRALETLLDREAAAQGLTTGKFLVRTLVCALTGAEGPSSPTRRLVEVLQRSSGLPIAEVSRLAGVDEAFAREALMALSDLRVDGMPEGLVRLEDRDGTAIWSLAA